MVACVVHVYNDLVSNACGEQMYRKWPSVFVDFMNMHTWARRCVIYFCFLFKVIHSVDGLKVYVIYPYSMIYVYIHALRKFELL